MLDMCKAFYSIDRTILLFHLEEALIESEMYMMNILINNLIIDVQYGMERGTDILTNTGACQCNCLSAAFFIVYLDKTIKPLFPYID